MPLRLSQNLTDRARLWQWTKVIRKSLSIQTARRMVKALVR